MKVMLSVFELIGHMVQDKALYLLVHTLVKDEVNSNFQEDLYYPEKFGNIAD